MPVVGLDEAAKLLGVSKNTVRRRIGRGELKASKVPTSHGVSWRITIPEKEEQPMVEERDRELKDDGDQEAEGQAQATGTPEEERVDSERETETASEEDEKTSEAEATFVVPGESAILEGEPILSGAAVAAGGPIHITPEEEPLEAEIAEREPLDPEAVCSICREPILPEDEYVVAAYGPVHEEECSHKTMSV